MKKQGVARWVVHCWTSTSIPTNLFFLVNVGLGVDQILEDLVITHSSSHNYRGEHVL